MVHLTARHAGGARRSAGRRYAGRLLLLAVVALVSVTGCTRTIRIGAPSGLHPAAATPSQTGWHGVIASSVGGKGGGVDCSPGTLDSVSTYCTGYCTWFVWQQRQEADLRGLGDAVSWYSAAQARNIPVGSVPVVGAIAWWGSEVAGGYGHVAFVTAASQTTVTYEEMNAHAGWNKSDTWTSTLGQKGAPDGYIYGGPAAGAEYVGHIVQWDGDTKTQKTAWLVIADQGHPRRNWIPTSSTYFCLKGRGAPGPDVLSATVLSNELPDEVGTPAQCGGTGGPTPTLPPPPPASNPPPTHLQPPPSAPSRPPTPTPTTPSPTTPPPTPQPTSPPTVPPTTQPDPFGYPGPVFTVMNTSETPPDGVWFRNSPHTADTSRITGLGVYMSEQVQLHCYAFGDTVGPYNDSLWYYATNVTRPTVNGQPDVGYLNAHYINDGQVANVIDPGVPAC